MIINVNFKNNILKYEFIFETKYNDLDHFDNNKKQNIKIINNKCQFIIPNNIKKINPDMMALIAIIIIFPFLGEKININTGVSDDFYQVFIKSGKNIGPINKQKYTYSDNNNTPSLSFKPSINCLSSLLLLPKNTYVINLSSLNPTDIYNQEYQYFILDNLLNFNYKLCVIRSDLENMICPSGFSHFLSCCIGNIIVSQDYGINNITLGYTLKNIHYLNNEIEQLDFKNFNFGFKNKNYYSTYEFWDNLFKIFNLKLNFNIIGITEIMTHQLVKNSKFKNLIKNSALLEDNQNCNSAISLFKLNLLDHIFMHKNINFEYLDFYYQIFNKHFKENNEYDYLSNISLICIIYFLYTKYNDSKEHLLFERIGIKKIICKQNQQYFFKINSSSFKYMDSKLLNSFLIKIQNNLSTNN